MAIDVKELISSGEIVISGRLVDASNATLFGHVRNEDSEIPIIYKPVAGERPLWDFPDGTLASREVAAFLFSEFADFDLVPFTILRDGPFGIGAVQEWITIDEEIDLIELAQSQDLRLRDFVIFDALINNTDRKIGHLLPTKDGRLMGCDHGVCFHQEDKLRTVLWQWRGDSLSTEELARLSKIRDRFEDFRVSVQHLLTDEEIDATLHRCERLLEHASFPLPSEEWPAIPWPPI